MHCLALLDTEFHLFLYCPAVVFTETYRHIWQAGVSVEPERLLDGSGGVLAQREAHLCLAMHHVSCYALFLLNVCTTSPVSWCTGVEPWHLPRPHCPLWSSLLQEIQGLQSTTMQEHRGDLCSSPYHTHLQTSQPQSGPSEGPS